MPENIKIQIEQLKSGLQAINNIADPNEKLAKYNELVSSLQNLQKQYQITSQEQRNLNANQQAMQNASILTNKIITWMNGNRNAAAQYDAELKKIILDLQNCSNKIDLTKLQQQFRQIQTQAQATNVTAQGFFGNLKSQIKDTITTMLRYQLAYKIVQKTIQAFKEMVNAVCELDASLTEFNKISALSTEQLEKFTEKAFDAASKIGRTGKDMVEAATEFKRAGYDIEQSLEMGNAALVLTNVADGIDKTSDAASTLISVIKGFNISESDIMSIVDKMDNVSNKSPVGFANLADGLERVSGTMSQAGNSIDQTLGLLTGGFAQLRNMEKVSTGLITISQRLRAVGEDGEEIDGLSAKLDESFGSIGVSIEDVNGDLRSTFEIMSDYAKVFPELTSEQKQYFAELAAGKRQVNVFNAIIQQISDVEKAVEQSIDSVGAAERENEIYRQSIQGMKNEFDSAFQMFATETISSDWIKSLISAGTELLGLLTNIVKQDEVIGGTIGFITDSLKSIASILKEISGNKAMGSVIKGFLTLQTISKGINIFNFLSNKRASTNAMNAFFQSAVNGTMQVRNGFLTVGEAERQIFNNRTQGFGIFKTISDDITGATKSISIFNSSLSTIKRNIKNGQGLTYSIFSGNKLNQKDIQHILNYVNTLKSGVKPSEAYKNNLLGCSVAAKQYVIDARKAGKSAEEMANGLKDVGKAANTATLAAKAHSAALKAVSIAGNIAMMIAISKAIQLAISAFDNYIHRLDNAKEALSSSTESYENNKKEIEELQQQVDECAKSIANLEKLEKDGSISIVQQDELDKLRQTNEELQRELLIKQELANVDARKTADDATKLFNTTVTSEYVGNIYYNASRGLRDVSQQQELEFSIEEYKRLAEQQKKNDLAYANGEISLKKYTKTNDELIQGMSDARNRATEMADTINQTGAALQKLEASGETLTSEQQGILEQTDTLGNEYSDFIHQIDATANAFDKLDEKQKRVRIKTRIVESGVSESDAQNIVNNFSEKDLDVVGSVKFDFEAPQKSDFDSAEEWGKTFAEKFLESAVEVIESDNNLQNAIDKTAEKMVTSLESLSDGFDKISAIYEDVQNKADFDYGSLIDEDFVNIFKAYTAEYENFVDVISNSPTDIAACQSAFDDLVTAWFNGQEPLKNITEETYALTVKWLEQNGVANANEVATYALAKSKVEAFIAGRDLSQVTDEEIAKFLDENAALGVTQEMFWRLQLEMINASNTKLNFNQQLAALNELAERAGIAAISLSNIGGVQTGNAIADNLINSIANPLGTKFQKAAIANQQKAIQDKINSGVPKISYAPRSTGSSGGGGSSSAKEKYVAEIDKYKGLSEAVEDVQTKIEHLNDVYDHTDDIDEQIALKDKLIGLYQEEKNALSALNNARDKEIADNIQKLRDANFQVDYDPKSDRLKIHNLEHLNELAQGDIEDKEKLIKKTEELNDANKDSAEQWTDLTYKIIEAGDAIKDLETKKYEQYIKDTEHLIALMSKRKDTLGGDIPFYTNMMNAAVERMTKLAKEGYEKNKDEIQQLQRDWMDYYDKRIEREKEILEMQLDDKDGALDAVIDLIDEQIKKLDNELDSMKKLNEERKEALELQKAQAALDKAKDQKVRKVLRYGKGYVYEADEDAIKEAQENLADLKYESKVSSIEKEKEKLEEYKNLWAEIPNLFEKYQNELLAEEILGSGWEQKILDGRLDVYNNFKDSYFDLQQDIFDKTEELNNHMSQEYLDMMEMFQKMAEMAEEPAAEEKKQGKIWYVQKNGQAPSYAQVGDKIVTKGGIYEIAEPNSEGAHYNAASGFWNRKISDYQANVVDGMWGTEVRNANAELSNILGLNTLSNKDIVDAAENQIDEIRNSIIASGALSKYTSENSEVTQDQIRTMFENMDTLDGNSVSVEGNTVKIGDNTYALEDLTDALNNFEIKVDMPQGTPDTSGTFDDSQMSKTDQQYIKQLQSAWNTAKANGDTEMMDKLHAMAEAKRDEYRSGKTPAEDVVYEKSKYDLNNTTKTGGGSHGGEKSALQREYEWQLTKAKEFGASKEYISKLESAIAREEYGSGHTIDTYKDQYGKTSTIINATDKSEANMSATDIQKKYNGNLNKNTSSMDKLGKNLGKTSDTLSDTSDSMYHASDSINDASENIGTSAKDIVDSNTGLKESLDGVKTAIDGMGSSSGNSDYSSESTYVGGTRFVTDKKTGQKVAAGDREIGISSKDKVVGTKTWSSGGKTYQTTSYQKPGGKIVTSTKVTSNDKKKKAKGGLNLPPDIYNVDELGEEMIIEPVEQPIQGRYHRMTYGGNVIPADVSEKLWEFGLDPAEFIEKNLSKLVQPNIYPTISPASSNVENHYHVESLALPNVQDIPSFIKNLSMLPNLASQYAARRV